MQLILPTEKFQESYISYIKELGNEERYPFPLDFEYADFLGLLKKLDNYAKGIAIPNDAVPSTTYWLMQNDEIIGVTNLRHFLNQQITFCGGHIGLGIRPSYRGKGFGHILMEKSIHQLNAMGVEAIHIHCYKENLASSAIIIANGGELKSEFSDNDKIIQRFVVGQV